jgi:hypothetical protein
MGNLPDSGSCGVVCHPRCLSTAEITDIGDGKPPPPAPPPPGLSIIWPPISWDLHRLDPNPPDLNSPDPHRLDPSIAASTRSDEAARSSIARPHHPPASSTSIARPLDTSRLTTHTPPDLNCPAPHRPDPSIAASTRSDEAARSSITRPHHPPASPRPSPGHSSAPADSPPTHPPNMKSHITSHESPYFSRIGESQ